MTVNKLPLNNPEDFEEGKKLPMFEVATVFKSIINTIDCHCINASLYTSDPSSNFVRNRKISPKDCTMFLLGLSKQSLRSAKLTFTSNKPYTYTSSALHQQRLKILPRFFEDLSDKINCTFKIDKEYKGYNLVAIDGSTLNIPYNPDDKLTYVEKKNGEHKGFNQLHLNCSCDCLTGKIHDVIIQTIHEKAEVQAAFELTSSDNAYKYAHNTIFIYDRGYHSYDLMANHYKNNSFFVIRSKNYRIINEIVKSGVANENDEYDVEGEIVITPSKSDDKYYPFHSTISKKQFTNYDDTFIYKLKIRIVRFKVEDTVETLITNVFDDTMTIDDFRKIYQHRWVIETSYRTLKYDTGLIFIHSTIRQLQLQEIYASIITHNIGSLIEYYTNLERELPNGYKTNKRNIRNCISLVTWGAMSIAKACYEIKISLVPSQTGRKFERNIKPKAHPSFYMNG